MRMGSAHTDPGGEEEPTLHHGCQSHRTDLSHDQDGRGSMALACTVWSFEFQVAA